MGVALIDYRWWYDIPLVTYILELVGSHPSFLSQQNFTIQLAQLISFVMLKKLKDPLVCHALYCIVSRLEKGENKADNTQNVIELANKFMDRVRVLRER